MPTPRAEKRAVLEVRLLGELSLSAEGETLALPASKKSRALLAYLVATGRPHLRERMCELLWDMPGDSRAALRWSLTKIRPLLDRGGITRLAADRERVAFERQGVDVDLDRLRHDVPGEPSAAPIETLRRAVLLFRGEFLEGLELPACYKYHAWCIAERESARRMRTAILAALAHGLATDPEQAIHFARARVAVDPLVEQAHVDLTRLLTRSGRAHDARRQYDVCRRILETELHTHPSPELELVRAELAVPSVGSRSETRQESSPARAPAPVRREARSESPAEGVRPAQPGPPALAGRQRERELVDTRIAAAARGERQPLLLFGGDPGMGKTRMLEYLADGVLRRGGKVLWGRAFEAELVRPYGAWIDAFRSLALPERATSSMPDLAPLLPELVGSGAAFGDRNRLFDAVVKLLASLVEGDAPIAVVLDDLQWFDEASAALLHFVARSLVEPGVLLATAARVGELSDNKPALRLTRSLTRERCLSQVNLGPLERDDVVALVQSVARDADAARISLESEGVPLFALELARAGQHGVASGPASLERLISTRLDELEGRAAEALPWAAALGRSFRADLLAKACAIPVGELLVAIDELERRAIIRSAPSVEAAPVFDFAHDLVRQTAYRRISEPRRGLMHMQIARTLAALPDPAAIMAGDLAHHAALGGDDELCARACADAGERCLSVFANAEAAELADRGVSRLHTLSRDARLPLQIRLLRVKVRSRAWRHRSPELYGEISRVALEAQAAGLSSNAAMALFVVSELNWAEGDLFGAKESALRSVEASRGADAATAAQMLGRSGRCLAQLEQNVTGALAMLEEATALAIGTGSTVADIALGLGIVKHHLGEDDEAVRLLLEGHDFAAASKEHWMDWECLSRLARLELERDRPRAALAYCEELVTLASKMGEGSEGPATESIEALARLKLGEPGIDVRIERAIARLRDIDSKAHLAYLLDSVAEVELSRGDHESARRRVIEAVSAAEIVGRRSEVARGRALSGRIALASGDRSRALAELEAIRGDLAKPMEVSARVRSLAGALADALGTTIILP
jgi:DNA-binding SARP family transcriptional activator/predicted ATPase